MRAWQRHDLHGPDGTLVVFERPAAADAPAVLLLHGFTGSHRGWSRVADHLPEKRVLAPDLPGHGASRFHDEVRACRMANAAARLIDLLDRLAVNRCTVAGYSMGGRVALYLALSQPQRVERLLLESASPGLESKLERATRRADDEALATRLERHGVEVFLEGWQRTPVLASQLQLSVALQAEAEAERRDCRAVGLAASLRSMGSGAQLYLGDRLHQLTMPVTCVAGGNDPKFAGLARALSARIPEARLEIVPGAGHNVHLERPAYVARLLSFNAETQRHKAPPSDTKSSTRDFGVSAPLR